jgi:hypothetical protein
LWFSVALFSLLLNGCFKESVSGDVTTITFDSWVPIVTLVVCVGGFILAWFLRNFEKIQGFCYLVMLGAPLALLFFFPATLLDKIVVDPNHFTLQTGFWFYPTTHDIKFAELSRIEIGSTVSYSRRGRNVSYHLECYKKRGGSERVPAGDMMRDALDKVLGMAAQQGVPVIDKRTD